jgi:hypothetical protein
MSWVVIHSDLKITIAKNMKKISLSRLYLIAVNTPIRIKIRHRAT